MTTTYELIPKSEGYTYELLSNTPAEEGFVSKHVVKPFVSFAKDPLGTVRNITDVALEVPAAVASGGLGMAAGNFAAAAGFDGGKVRNELTYVPRNPIAQEALSQLGAAADTLKLAGYPAADLNLLRTTSGAAATTAKQAQNSRIARQLLEQQQLGNEALRVAGSQRMNALNLKMNPENVVDSNMNFVGSKITGPNVINANAYQENRPIFNSIARKETGIPEGVPLGTTSYAEVKTNALKPYDEIRAIKRIPTDEKYLLNLKGKTFLEDLPEEEKALLKNCKQVYKLIEKASLPEFTGVGAVEIMKQFREEANNVFSNPAAKNPELALANAKRNVAKQIEGLLDRQLPSLGYPDLSARFKAGREQYAKASVYEKITDKNGNINPIELSKLRKSATSYSGLTKDLADLAQMFPEVMKPDTGAGMGVIHGIRSGVLGTLGGGIGYLAGGPQGAVYGGLAGAASDPVLSYLTRKLMLSSPYQKSFATIPDPSGRGRLGYPLNVFPPKNTTSAGIFDFQE